ncbi:hypothetical protein ACVIHI_005804 [Bradyrhizobium sp. USDA 4524]|uniref:hypothetical protein n=1 Tax=unclassified Bradyrhizobium TaxID=2631580 RepID=UPI0020A01420|nr:MULTISPECIES: hypothetical protein [unclassified Bradyrhizobium]MCP1841277.1 hypothetical protein [Bradyrhizobium sp. USDA 4538]MCP1901840.1 hypothetical protein [Bradyrhizobium sp. USDA 4537]MCP1992503.1 hypothetical protein [Bradyrhizobium sp. USDA 4539]
MPIAMSPSKLSIAIAAILIASGGAAIAQTAPDTENGRYALSPAGDGFLRLDTHTGAVSTCTNSSAGWACYMVPDERAALDAEIGRLQADNDKLKGELAARAPSAKTDEALPKSDQLKKAEPKTEPKVAEGERKIEIPLPSDRDMDRMMSFLERAWRRLIEMANRVQRDVNGGKI